MRIGTIALGTLATAGIAGCEDMKGTVDEPDTAVLTGEALETTRFTWNATVERNQERLFVKGRAIFRDDTFGSEAFWGGKLRLHEAIAGAANGGVGPGLSPRMALELGLKVAEAKLPDDLRIAIREGQVDLDDPATTLALLQLDAVIGVRGTFDGTRITSVGITCALCHSTVDDQLAPGIGLRRDGWPARDLDVGQIVALAPDLTPFQDLLGVDRDTVVRVLTSWGPGKYDAFLNMDGKAFRPDGKSAATLIPAAFGLAGQNLHTYTGMGSVPYWNAYVANTQMHGQGTFVDRRLSDSRQYPLVARTGFDNKRDPVDLITSKLPALHFYQLAIPAPTPPTGSFDREAAERGDELFSGKAKCAGCHVEPLYSEPGFAMHTGEEIGIDNFQANRSPEHMYRTTPLKGLFTRMKGGFFHDGRFPDLLAVVEHYNRTFALGLSDSEKADLVEYLKSL